MRKTFLKVFATLVLLSAGFVFTPTANATASALPAPPASESTGMSHSLVLAAAIVCGGNGCNPVHTKAQKKRKFQTLGHG